MFEDLDKIMVCKIIDPADEEEQGKKDSTGDESRNKKQTDQKSKESSKPASSRTSTHLSKKTQLMVAELNRLKTQMTEFQQSIHRPPV